MAVEMQIRGIVIEDTFAEGFTMAAARVIITAVSARWCREAASKMTGFATSIIGCKCEAAIEREWPPSETPDERPGVSVLMFAMDADGLAKRLTERIGQTILTCPTASCFDGLPGASDRVPAGRGLKMFGDGWQVSKVVGDRRYWRVPVTEGECLIEESYGVEPRAVGGGNFLILAEDVSKALAAAEAAVDAISRVPDVIMPFPGGIARSASKVRSRRYSSLIASTNDAYCPTIQPLVDSALGDDVNSVLEIVLDGLGADAVAEGMRVGVNAACRPGVRRISAGNYDGKLGSHRFHLHQIVERS